MPAATSQISRSSSQKPSKRPAATHAKSRAAEPRRRIPQTSGAIAPKILAWTTTPWTLPSNLALAVHPDTDYALLEKGGEHWVIARASREAYATELDGWVEVGLLKGRELIGRRYEPMFPFFADTENAFVVLGGEFIELGEGTGVVHIAPAFGEDDMAAR